MTTTTAMIVTAIMTAFLTGLFSLMVARINKKADLESELLEQTRLYMDSALDRSQKEIERQAIQIETLRLAMEIAEKETTDLRKELNYVRTTIMDLEDQLQSKDAVIKKLKEGLVHE